MADTITRYDMYPDCHTTGMSGEWVRFYDHQARVQELEARNEELEYQLGIKNRSMNNCMWDDPLNDNHLSQLSDNVKRGRGTFLEVLRTVRDEARSTMADGMRELATRNAALSADCARISTEFGLPATMAPADGEIARMVADNASLRAKLAQLEAPPVAWWGGRGEHHH